MSARDISEIIRDVNSTLNGKGFPTSGSDKEKLCQIWDLYQQAENNLASALGNIDILKKQFNEDQKQYEGYVDHLNMLSQGREDLILEYEAENKELRQDIDDLAQQLASFRNPETDQALIDAGYEDITSNKPREQIACLLIEIARLKDELEAAKEQCVIQTPEGQYTAEQLYNMLHENRQDLPFHNQTNRIIDENGGFNSGHSYSNLRDLLRSVDDLEIMNERLKQRLKAISPKDYEDVMAGRTHDNQFSNRESVQKRLKEAADSVVWVPPKNLEEATQRLRDAEVRAAESGVLHQELQDCLEELERMRRRIYHGTAFGMGEGDGDGSRKTDGRNDVMKHNDLLQQMLGSVEARLQQLKVSADKKDTDDDRKALADQLQNVQRGFDQIKAELVKMMEKYNQQYRKYTELKLQNKNKIFRMKEAFKMERQQLNEKVEHLENELALIKVTLTKELEYKENMEKSHHNLLLEQRDLLSKLSEHEDVNLEQTRVVSSLKVRAEYLEENNNVLNQRLDTLTKEKYNLERIMKEIQLEKEKEDIYRLISSTSPDARVTINSVNTSAADEQELLESLLRSRNAGSGSSPGDVGARSS